MGGKGSSWPLECTSLEPVPEIRRADEGVVGASGRGHVALHYSN